jgi:hypothetical protein
MMMMIIMIVNVAPVLLSLPLGALRGVPVAASAAARHARPRRDHRRQPHPAHGGKSLTAHGGNTSSRDTRDTGH